MLRAWEQTAVIQRVDGADLFRLVEPLEYRSALGTEFVVLAGFLTDGASIPRFVRGLVGDAVGGEYTEPAILHDALCRSGLFSVKRCDELMLEAMAAHDTPLETVNSIALGLRLARLWRRRRPVDPSAYEYLEINRT